VLVLLVVLALVAIAGCGAKGGGINPGDVAANPIAQGAIIFASEAGCKAWAEKNPDSAAQATVWIDGVVMAAQSCRSGLAAGLTTEGGGGQ
jgi:hypothetical protein